MPPKWAPLAVPQKLKEDAGVYYRDRNAARYPEHPMEPAVEAIMTANSTGSVGIDVVACGSTLGNLLRFARGDDKPFRMLVQVVGRTVHLVRRENSPKETIPDVRGYGHTFPDAYTSWDPSVRGSSSHQRIMHYDLGGLGCLVRFEGDGYLPEKTKSNKEKFKAKIGSSPGDKAGTGSVEELTSSLATHGVSSTVPSGADGPLQMSAAGISVPQQAIFDLKTRSIRRKAEEDAILESELPRFWLAQIPNFILAYHSSGTFTDIDVHDVRAAAAKWESDKATELRRFGALLRRILEISRAKDDGKLEIVRNAGEPLQVRKQRPDVPASFSPGTMERWERWLDGGAKDVESDEGEVEEDSFESDTISDDDGGHGDHDWLGDDLDWAICDKDCGWCGRCMNHVDDSRL